MKRPVKYCFTFGAFPDKIAGLVWNREGTDGPWRETVHLRSPIIYRWKRPRRGLLLRSRKRERKKKKKTERNEREPIVVLNLVLNCLHLINRGGRRRRRDLHDHRYTLPLLSDSLFDLPILSRILETRASSSRFTGVYCMSRPLLRAPSRTSWSAKRLWTYLGTFEAISTSRNRFDER